MQTSLGLRHRSFPWGGWHDEAKERLCKGVTKSITLLWNHWHDIGMILAMMACLQAKCFAMCQRCASSLADTLNGLGMESCWSIIIEFSQKHITPCVWFSYLASFSDKLFIVINFNNFLVIGRNIWNERKGWKCIVWPATRRRTLLW